MAHGDVLDSYLARLRAAPGLDVDLPGNRAPHGGDTSGSRVAEASRFFEQAFWKVLEGRAAVIRVVGEMDCVRDVFASESEMLAFEAAFNLFEEHSLHRDVSVRRTGILR